MITEFDSHTEFAHNDFLANERLGIAISIYANKLYRPQRNRTDKVNDRNLS